MRRALLLLLLTGCLGSPAAPSHADYTPRLDPVAPAPPPPPPVVHPPFEHEAELGAWIDAYASGFGAHWGDAYAVQGFVAVARDGKIVAAKAYGKANRERGAAGGPDTRYRIGSLTKQFTSVALLQLAEQKKLDTNDPIRKYVPSLPDWFAPVTLHHLLTHTSGIANYTADPALMKARGEHHDPDQVIAAFKDKPLAFTPGDKFSYSNSNYFLLGLVIEKVSGQPYEKYLQDHVLGPAKMMRTSTVDAPDAADTAVGYQTDPDKDTLVPASPVDMSVPFAAGALRSTANDMVAWDRALEGDTLLTLASRRRFATPEKGDYAYGITVKRLGSHEVHWHNGGIDGFNSYFARVPDMGAAIVVLTNTDAGLADKLGAVVLEMVTLGKRAEPTNERVVTAMDPATLAAFSGEYTLSDGSAEVLRGLVPKEVIDSVRGLSMTSEGGRLYMKPVGQDKEQVFRSETGTVFTKVDGVEIRVDEAGKKGEGARSIRLLQGGLSMLYERNGGKKPASKGKGGK